ncbi:tetratricopeptide repeat protein [Ruegeria sp.]|uniref:tetratricopeptide repeat protein n=1 Tax=Ruegeria sp. TaxID=1879320 RepID=UPI003C7C4BF2
MKRVVIALTLSALPFAGQAETCPDALDHSADIDALIAQVQGAASQADARVISNQMWELWTDAPDVRAQALLDQGMGLIQIGDLAGAYSILNALVDYCPDYAEGYNQRAFASYLRKDYAAALNDLDAAIDLSPTHIGALSGRALSLLGLERIDEARAALKHALQLNPWLAERALLEPGGALDPPGKDI